MLRPMSADQDSRPDTDQLPAFEEIYASAGQDTAARGSPGPPRTSRSRTSSICLPAGTMHSAWWWRFARSSRCRSELCGFIKAGLREAEFADQPGTEAHGRFFTTVYARPGAA